MALSRDQLDQHERDAADSEPRGRVTTRHENVDLTDEELERRLGERTHRGEDTWKLRDEYDRRLIQRGQ